MTDLQRITYVRPAYDCIRNKPCVHGSDACTKSADGRGSNHGIHNAEMHMGVVGPRGEVTLVMSTGWDLPSVPNYVRQRTAMRYPIGSYVEFHTDAPQCTGHEPSSREVVRDDAVCRDWDTCYNDRGYLMAEEPAALLVAQGSDAVWKWLEAQYNRIVCQMLDVTQENGER